MADNSQLKEQVNDWLHTTCGWPWWLVKVTSVLVVVNDWLRKRLGL